MRPLVFSIAGAAIAIVLGFHGAQITNEVSLVAEQGKQALNWPILVLYITIGYGLVGAISGFALSLIAARSVLISTLLTIIVLSWTGWRAIDREMTTRSARTLHFAIVSHDAIAIDKAIADAWALDAPYQGKSAIHVAIEMQDSSALRKLLLAGADPELMNAHDESPLLLAVRRGDLELVGELVRFGANPEGRTQYGTPLDYARREGPPDVYEMLAAQHEGRSTDFQRFTKRLEFQDALRRGDHEAVARLIEQGVNPNEMSQKGSGALVYGPLRRDEITQRYSSGGNSAAELGVAIRSGNLDEVQSLVAAGADLSTVWWNGTQLESALTIALSRDDERLVSYLLPRMGVFLYDDLLLSAEKGLNDVVRRVVKAGIDPACARLIDVSGACSPVLAAAHANHHEATVALLESLGADLSACDATASKSDCRTTACLVAGKEAAWKKFSSTDGCTLGILKVTGEGFPGEFGAQ